jgi:hypothetical protein
VVEDLKKRGVALYLVVPALKDQRAFALQGQFRIPLDPVALDSQG